MLHRLTALFLLFSLLLSTVGCAKSAPRLTPKNPVRIELWHYYNGPQQEAFNALLDEFNQTEGMRLGVTVEGYSQGSIGQLTQSVLDSANKKAGAKPVPQIFAAYADTAFEVDALGLVAELDPYFTQQELEAYLPEYLSEGRFDKNGKLKIFPIAKSSELMMINKTYWDRFAAATGATTASLATMESLAATAEAYYRWTDSLTPEPNDGKSLFGRDSMANYMFIGARELGVELFQPTADGVVLNLDRAVLRRLWDNFYLPYVKGYFTHFGKFRSDDIKTGDILAMVGSTTGIIYLPKQVTNADNSTEPIELLTLPAPCFEGGAAFAVQQGAGMVVTKSDPLTELAAVTFLKWFTQKEQNMRFAVAAGYLPVTKAAATPAALEDFLAKHSDINSNLAAALRVSYQVTDSHTMYAPKAFDNSNAARNLLEHSLIEQCTADRKLVQAALAAGSSLEQAVAPYVTDARFDQWLSSLTTALEQIIAP
ncbi:MAG: extracellular solute-binding protein [Angelakisella sp.]